MGGELYLLKVEELVELQKEMASKVVISSLKKEPKKIAGFDLSYPQKHTAVAVCVVMSYPELDLLEMKWVKAPVTIPYIPGLLSFREGPAMESVYALIEEEPDLLFFDGQGIAHPRGIGLASYMAIKLGKPAIGVAKSHLFGEYRMPEEKRGEFSYLYSDGKQIGAVLRTKDRVRPLFVSPGGFVDIRDCIIYTLSTCRGYRLPEPTRIADMYTKKLRKEVS